MPTLRNGASYRDPGGFVFYENGRVLRAVTDIGVDNARAVRATGLVDRLVAAGRLLHEREVGTTLAGRRDVRLVLEHPPLPFVSYPYEWPFLALQAAALLHLDVQLEALDAGVMLSDASAFNVQFIGARPIFIDHLSFRPYREGELWAAHTQFCEQFLHPLLLRSMIGIEFQPWYRGRMEGIPGASVSRLLRLRDKLRWNVLVNVVLPARLQQVAAGETVRSRVQQGKLSRAALRHMLSSLRRWIERMQPRGLGTTVWANYEETIPADEVAATTALVREFVAEVRPKMLWDLGCNAGRYGEVALDAGAGYVVGFDSDAGALHHAFRRARDGALNLLPLLVDVVDPSPSQGWRGRERDGILGRGNPDALLALAVIHHVAIGRNVPIDEIVDLLTTLAPEGIVGFVPNTDPRAQALFMGREALFRSYTLENFLSLLRGRARIVRQQSLPNSERVLVWYSAT